MMTSTANASTEEKIQSPRKFVLFKLDLYLTIHILFITYLKRLILTIVYLTASKISCRIIQRL